MVQQCIAASVALTWLVSAPSAVMVRVMRSSSAWMLLVCWLAVLRDVGGFVHGAQLLVSRKVAGMHRMFALPEATLRTGDMANQVCESCGTLRLVSLRCTKRGCALHRSSFWNLPCMPPPQPPGQPSLACSLASWKPWSRLTCSKCICRLYHRVATAQRSGCRHSSRGDAFGAVSCIVHCTEGVT